jgi:hypothetical protein
MIHIVEHLSGITKTGIEVWLIERLGGGPMAVKTEGTEEVCPEFKD